jgi:NAD(P)-dependent dehydrogenase (short-subunit alcohol dehydrogenase family)
MTNERGLEGQVCIVTGTASGIGRAIARRFASHGATVVVADLTETVIEGGEPTVDVIKTDGGIAHFFKMDVSVADDVNALVEFSAIGFGLETWAFKLPGHS